MLVKYINCLETFMYFDPQIYFLGIFPKNHRKWSRIWLKGRPHKEFLTIKENWKNINGKNDRCHQIMLLKIFNNMGEIAQL